MKTTAWLAFALAVSLVWGANGQARTVTVIGEGIVESEPDMALLELGIDMVDTSVAQLYQTGSAAMTSIIRAVKHAGIPGSDVSTGRLYLEPEYRPYRDTADHPRKYSMTNTIAIKVHDLRLVSSVLDSATRAGANSVSRVEFGFRNPDSLVYEAQARALKAADDKAHRIAANGRVKLGRIVSITDDPSRRGYTSLTASQRAETGMPIMVGLKSIQAVVQVTYSLE